MRFLLFVGFFALAVLLFAHGLFLNDQAEAAYATAGASPARDFSALLEEHPYSAAATRAVLETVERRAAHEIEGALPGKENLRRLLDSLLETSRQGFRPKPPFVLPFSAAVLGLLGVALALIMPGTRFRGLALVALIFGAAAALPGLLPPDDQAALVRKFDPAKHLAAHLPRVALGLCVAAGLTLGAKVRRRPKDDES